MSDLAAIGGVVAVASACASGVCVAMAYYIPTALRDAANEAWDSLENLLEDAPQIPPPPAADMSADD